MPQGPAPLCAPADVRCPAVRGTQTRGFVRPPSAFWATDSHVRVAIEKDMIHLSLGTRGSECIAFALTNE